MSQVIKVGAAHVAPVLMDAAASARKAASWIRAAGDDGVRLLVFPEVFLPGFPYWINCYPPLLQADVNRRYQDQSVELDGPEIRLLRETCAESKVAVIMGASERRTGSRTCFNSAIFIDHHGQLVGVHRKLKPTYAERYIWGEGDGSTLIAPELVGTRVSALCCWEHTMNLARQAVAEQQARIHAALWPGLSTLAGFATVANLQIEAMMKNHAITGQCFVVCASSPVTQQMLDWMERELGPQSLTGLGGGWTALIHPFAAVLAGPVVGVEEQLVTADINVADVDSVKLWLDGTGHYARPDVLRLVVDRSSRSSCTFVTEQESEKDQPGQ